MDNLTITTIIEDVFCPYCGREVGEVFIYSLADTRVQCEKCGTVFEIPINRLIEK